MSQLLLVALSIFKTLKNVLDVSIEPPSELLEGSSPTWPSTVGAEKAGLRELWRLLGLW